MRQERAESVSQLESFTELQAYLQQAPNIHFGADAGTLSLTCQMKPPKRRRFQSCAVYLFLAAITVVALTIIFIINESTKSLPFGTNGGTMKKGVILTRPIPESQLAVMMRNPKQHSKFAYVTLLSGIDSSLKYRGFLYNVLIMKRALLHAGSVADLIALIGISETDITPFISDLELLQEAGIILHILPRFLDESNELGFAEMALQKITPWSFTQYDRIQFLDGDVMPLRSLDCYFNLDANAFTVGAVSPLNSGWYLAIPDQSAYDYMLERSIWRLGRDWDKMNGWREVMPAGFMYRGGKLPCEQW